MRCSYHDVVGGSSNWPRHQVLDLGNGVQVLAPQSRASSQELVGPETAHATGDAPVGFRPLRVRTYVRAEKGATLLGSRGAACSPGFTNANRDAAAARDAPGRWQPRDPASVSRALVDPDRPLRS